MTRQNLTICICACLLIALAGCSPYASKSKVKKEFDMDGKSVAVIPFQDPNNDYFRSMVGNRIAKLTSVHLQRYATDECSVKPYNETYEGASKMDYDDPDWQEIGKKLEVDYLLIGRIKRFRTQGKGSINMLNGVMDGHFELLDINDKGKVVWQKNVTALYPEDQKWGLGMDTFEISKGEMLIELVAASAVKIGKHFYDYMEDD